MKHIEINKSKQKLEKNIYIIYSTWNEIALQPVFLTPLVPYVTRAALQIPQSFRIPVELMTMTVHKYISDSIPVVFHRQPVWRVPRCAEVLFSGT
jgi:hypothetical protein